MNMFDMLFAKQLAGGGGTPEQTITTEGVPPLTFQSNGKPASAYSIVANMTQSGEPSTASPSFPQQFGDLVASGTHAGEYEVPITVGGTTKTIYLDQPLRKIGDYADTISSDGTVTRRIVEVVLTGQESWGYSSGMHKLGIDPPNLYLRELKLIACCSHYKAVANQPQASLQNGELTFLVSGSGSNLLYIRDTDYSDSATFKEQLALLYALNAPVRVWYVLAEAETETVTVPELTLTNGSNTLTIGTEEQPSNVSITCTVGGGSTPAPVLIDKTITANGEYDPADDGADGYRSVTANVANSYSASDEGKVVSNGALVSQSSDTATQNGEYDTTLIDSFTVDVEGGSATLTTKSISANGTYAASGDNADGYSSVTVSVPNSYSAGDEGKVVSSGALVSQTTDSTTTNGTVDTTTISSLTVNVPNTYAAGDEGKVVSNGALVSQSSSSTSSNGTVDTTLINSLAISVPTYSSADNGKVIQNGALAAQSTHKSITANGTGIDTTYYSSVDVAVPNSYSEGDEGKVVSSGSLVAQSTHKSITANGTGIDTTTYSSVDVAVPNSYAAGDEGKVVSNGALVSQSSSSALSNGTVDTTLINSLAISVPNTYSAGDEGKVVSNGALVAQGSDEATQNGTVDTTLISSLLVNVASSGITEGTLTPINGTAHTNPIAKAWGTDGFICAVLQNYKFQLSSGSNNIATVSGISFPSTAPQSAVVYASGTITASNSALAAIKSANFDFSTGRISISAQASSNFNTHIIVVITW